MPPKGFLVGVLAALTVAAFCDLLGGCAAVRYPSAIGGDSGMVTGSRDDLETAASLYGTSTRWQGMVFLPCAVAFVTWFAQMRRATGLMAPGLFRNGPGRAVGAWIIPVANLWMPYRVALGTWAASAPVPRDRETPRMRTWPVHLWWALFVSVALVKAIAGDGVAAAPLSALRDGVVWYAVADGLHVLAAVADGPRVLAAVAAGYFAIRLTAMQPHKAEQGAFATAPVNP
ncbi:DUF4328 domain-containing protein [Streptomyces sp. NPDC088254]|uniref:DUF4328 domain-containing protein n=1 Tax=Streptomyces sp. NPDC088254 TaxID=3365847 RepID=UPI00380E7969